MSLRIGRRLTLRLPTTQQIITGVAALVIATSALLELPPLKAHAAPTHYAQTGWLNPHDQMPSAYGISVDASGNRYVADMCGNYKIYKYSPAGQLLMKFGPSDWSSSPDAFGCTYDTAVDSRGVIYVSDGDNYRVQVYDKNGNYLRTIGGVQGTGNGQFSYSAGLVVDSQDNLYVGDNSRIEKFDKDGNFIQVISTPAMTYTLSSGYSYSILQQIAVDKNDNIYAVETNGTSISQVQKFSPAGSLLATFGSYTAAASDPTPGAMHSPCAIAVDRLGNIFVDDSEYINVFNSAGTPQSKTYIGNSSVENTGYINDMVFDSNDNLQLIDGTLSRLITLNHNLQYVSEIGQAGTQPGHYFGPLGIYRDEGVGRMYVADGVNARIQVLDLNGNYLSSFGSYGTGVGQLNRPGHITKNPLNGNLYVNNFNGIDIFTPSGTSVARLTGFGDAGITFDPSGKMYTSVPEVNYPSHTPGYANIRDNSGNILTTFGNTDNPATGGIRHATQIRLDASGNIYILDGTSNYVQIYAPDGTFLRNFTGQFNQANDLWVAPDGTIYVADTGNGRFQVFSGTGTLLDQFGTQGFGPGKFQYPQAFTVGSDSTFYIADDVNNFVAVYKPSSYTAPTAPSNFTVTGNTTANWSAPSDTGGEPLVSYTLRYKQDTATYWSEAHIPALATSYSFGSMPSGTYQYEITASNAAGESVAAVPGASSTTPSSPLSVSATSPANNTLATTWQAPTTDGGSPLTGYLFEYKPTADSTWTQLMLAPSATSHTLTNVPGGSYDVRVSAVNAIGASMPSAVSSTTVASTAPSSPPAPPATNPPATSPTIPAVSVITTASTTTYVAPPSAHTSADTSSSSPTPVASSAPSPLQTSINPSQPGSVTIAWQPPAGQAPTRYVIEYRNAAVPANDTTTPWRQATVAQPGDHSATFTLPIGSYTVRVAALFSGKQPRIILGVAHITIPDSSAEPAVIPATQPKPAPLAIVAICIGLVTFAILILIFFGWKRRRRKQQADANRRTQVPPRWQ